MAGRGVRHTRGPIGYKHLDRKLALKFLTGDSIQLGTYRYFREMETDRRDDTEGIIDAVIDGPLSQSMQSTINEIGVIEIADGCEVDIVNVRMVTPAADQLIFCSSAEPDFRGARAKNDAIFEIDLGGLATSILNALPFLTRAVLREVAYSRADQPLLRDGIPPFDPFNKPARFKDEKEIRLLFQQPVTARFIRVRVPEAAKHIRLISI